METLLGEANRMAVSIAGHASLRSGWPDVRPLAEPRIDGVGG
ncbi:hypothetical protein CLBKND_04779 [Methylorubrum aminovorans]